MPIKCILDGLKLNKNEVINKSNVNNFFIILRWVHIFKKTL